MQVVAFPLKKRMFLHVQHNVEITRGPAVRPSFAQSGKPNARPIFDSGWDLCIHRPLTQHAAFALALQTWISDHAARTLTSGTSARHAEESLLIPYLAASPAGSARHGGLARSGTRAAALLARFVAANRNTRFRAKNRFFEFQRDIFAQIGTALSAAAPPRTAAEKISETEKVSEDFADVLENRGVKAARPSTAHGSMPEAVVCRPLVGIRQDGVGFAALFEFLFRVGIIRIAVRMKLQRQSCGRRS